MENKYASSFMDYNDHPLQRANNKGVTKSVFEIGSYRHNVSTRDQLY